MHEIYRELVDAPKKSEWKFGVVFFITIIIPLTFLIGVSCLLSLPSLIKEKLLNST